MRQHEQDSFDTMSVRMINDIKFPDSFESEKDLFNRRDM